MNQNVKPLIIPNTMHSCSPQKNMEVQSHKMIASIKFTEVPLIRPLIWNQKKVIFNSKLVLIMRHQYIKDWD